MGGGEGGKKKGVSGSFLSFGSPFDAVMRVGS